MRPIWIGVFAVAAVAVGSLVITLDEVRGDAAKPAKTIETAGAETIAGVLTAAKTIEVSPGQGPGQGEEPPISTRSPLKPPGRN